MKKLALILTLLALSWSTHAGVVTNLVVSSIQNQRVTKTITLSANQNAKGLNQICSSIGGCELYQIIDGVRLQVPSTSTFATLTFYGPCVIEFAAVATGSPDGSITGLATFEINGLTPDGPPVTNIPSNAVVIPSDSAGPVTILLESSVDLVTWNSALPGIYGTSTTNRFFRVRAVR